MPRGATVLATKLRPPLLRPDLVDRAALVRRVAESPQPVIAICAPAGYGKTTLLAQCAAAAMRPVAWLSLDAADNDPVLLLTELATAVDQVLPVDGGVFESLLAPEPALATEVLPRLLNDLSRGPALTLVLDDVHVVRSAESIKALTNLCERLPVGVKVIVTARVTPTLPLSRLRARGLLLELGAAELALSIDDARRVLAAAGVGFDELTFDAVFEQTEGWPLGIYLAGATARASDNPSRALRDFSGEERSVFDYLSSELLARLPAEQLRVLLHASILDRFSASLCDAILERDDSHALLAELESSTGFLIPLDQRREWYRFHHLFAETLRAVLMRTEPAIVPTLHDLASRWYEQHDAPVEAILHALAAPDRMRATDLFARHVRTLFHSGLQSTIRGWIATFSDHDLAACPPAAAGAAWVMGQLGERAHTRRYIGMLERARADGPFPLGESSSESAVALLKAAFAWEGVSQMRALAEVGYRLEPPGSEAHERAALFLGANLVLRGRLDAAQALLEQAAAAGAAGASSAMFALGLLALVHLEARRLDDADACLHEGFGLIERMQLHGYSASATLFAACACLEIERGDRKAARTSIDRAVALLPATSTVPWSSILLCILSSRVNLALGDVQQAELLLGQAHHQLARYPDAGILPQWELRQRRALEAAHGGAGVLREPLTEAELRVLELVPTHLTVEEIGRTLCISRNTVKSHLKMIYSKLNVGSRGEAVERAMAVGLIGRPPSRS